MGHPDCRGSIGAVLRRGACWKKERVDVLEVYLSPPGKRALLVLGKRLGDYQQGDLLCPYSASHTWLGADEPRHGTDAG